jgi:hypothetical protein
VEPALIRFDALPEEEKIGENLEVMLAEALMNSLTSPIRTYNARTLVNALILGGNIKAESTREFLQREADRLLIAAGIGVAHHDPWYELAVLARKIVERIANWISFFKESPVGIPHELLPFNPLPHTQNLNLQLREANEPALLPPPGLHLAGKIVRNRTVICVSLHPVEVFVAANKIRREDFAELENIISHALEAFAWDVHAFNNLFDVRSAIQADNVEAAKSLWKDFIESTKAMPKATGSTSVLIVSKLINNALAHSVAKISANCCEKPTKAETTKP